MKSRFLLPLFLFCLFTSGSVLAQEAKTNKKPVLENKTEKPNAQKASQKEELDTGESLLYVGDKLWFQLKRRLHLTSKEEEEEAKKTEKEKVVLNIGGIKFER